MISAPAGFPSGWYAIAATRDVLVKRPLRVRRLGKDLVLFRDPTGEVFVASARCPHRGADLGLGRVIDGELECAYHGFRFRGDGECSLVPCEGRDYRPSKKLRLNPLPIQNAHGLIWLGIGECAELPLPWFEDAPGLRGAVTAELSWNVPFARAMEGQLDVHHFPFAHRSVGFGRGTRVDPFEAKLEDDGETVTMFGRLRRADAPRDRKAFDFHLRARFPGSLLARFGRITLSFVVTPIDAENTFMHFRYSCDLPIIGKLVAWLAVWSELRLVQPDDERLLRSAGPGFDAGENVYVPCDAAFLLWHKLYRARMSTAHDHGAPTRRRSSNPSLLSDAPTAASENGLPRSSKA